MERKKDTSFYFMDRIWVSLVGDVRRVIFKEAHKSRYFVHPGADKMYHDLRDMYWWPGMKRDIAIYEKLKAVRGRQKSYANKRSKPLESEKCLADANLHVPLDEIKVDKTLRFVEEPVEIMDREIKELKRRKIALVKVRWNSKCGPEFIWEHED
nr:putative reverse transcriptase domain-containing protein [Tanacetum cinerariifolium]